MGWFEKALPARHGGGGSIRLNIAIGVESMHQQRHDGNLRSCEVVFQRGGYDVQTLYWTGSIEEVRELARHIAFRGGADTYRINEVRAAPAAWCLR